MPEPLLFFASSSASDNQAARTALSRLGPVDIRIVSDATFLEGAITLPFVQTFDGGRHFGVASIESFVERRLSAG
jgi:hypothetical protein